MDEILTVKAFDTGANFVVFCPHCGRYHLHSRYEGHALSHCVKRPADHPGAFEYVLRLAGLAPKAMLRDMRRARPKGPPWCF